MKIKYEKTYLLLFLVSAVFFVIFRIPYRSYIYQNNFYDFHIADVAPNFFTVLLFVFLKKTNSSIHNNTVLCISTFIGLVFYDYFIQEHFYKGATIDILDIIASFFAAILSYFMVERIDKNYVK